LKLLNCFILATFLAFAPLANEGWVGSSISFDDLCNFTVRISSNMFAYFLVNCWADSSILSPFFTSKTALLYQF